MQQANCVLGVIVGAEGIGAHHFSQGFALMCRRASTAPAHFRQGDVNAALSQLPRRFASCEAASDDVYMICHKAFR